MWFKYFLFCVFLSSILTAASANSQSIQSSEKEYFGKLENGQEVYLFTITNKNGLSAQIINFGAIVVSLNVPDKSGKIADVILGYDDIKGFENDKSFLGAIVGRYGNRINRGKFILDGKEYQLSINDGVNHLHGGIKGFNKVFWEGEQLCSNSVKLTYHSPDGEEGYPGNVDIAVIYTLNDDNEFRIDYTGTADSPTILNPTSHCYFNLTGSPENNILNHELTINAEQITPVVAGLIPTGELDSVAGTPMDFRTPTPIGKHIDDEYKQLELAGGYDHNWVLNNFNGKVRSVCSLYDPLSGRVMEMLTDQPGLQFYSGNFLDGSIMGKNKIKYKHRSGLCLEAQGFPDSPNQPDFPSVVLNPGEVYKQVTIYRFSVK